MRSAALALALLTATATAIAQDQTTTHLVRFTSVRTDLSTGGHLTPDCTAVLVAEVADAAAGAAVDFKIASDTGRGRAVPAILSSTRVHVDKRGLARTILLSADAEDECCVFAATAGGPPLELRINFRHVVPETILVASTNAVRDPVGPHIDARVYTLTAQLSDPAVEVRTAAMRMLVAMGRDAVGSLVAAAGDSRLQQQTRRLAIKALGEIRDEEADDRLLVLLAHPLPDVRAAAEDAIARMRSERAAPLGESALITSDPAVRAAGVRILSAIKIEQAARLALESLSDQDPFVRATAIWETARHDKAAAVDAIARGIRDKSVFVRTVSAKAAVLLGETASDSTSTLAPLLHGLLTDASVSVRSAAVRAVASLETGPETRLLDLFTDEDPRVRRSIALALPWRRDVLSSLRLLRRLVGDKDKTVRNVASRAIAEAGGAAEMDILVDMLASEDKELCDMAITSLRRIACFDFGWLRASTDAERAEVRRHWQQWHVSHRTGTRRGWLWQALDLPGSKLRGHAGLELVRLLAKERQQERLQQERRSLGAALVKVLNSCSKADGYSEKHVAAQALLVLGMQVGQRALAADLEDEMRYVRLSAARHMVAGLMSDAATVPWNIEYDSIGALIAALDDASVSVRRNASRSLVEYTGRSFGYQPHAPAGHRRRASAKWRNWLADLGPTDQIRRREK